MTVYSQKRKRRSIPLVAALAFGLSIVGHASPMQVFAGDEGIGHVHGTKPATKEKILKTAVAVRGKLIREGKITTVWEKIEPAEASQVTVKGKKEWLVTFRDPQPADDAKTTLYMFFSLSGNYLAANFTGK